jgi:hypothetical protein
MYRWRGCNQDVPAGAGRARSNSAGSRNSTFSSIPGSTDTSIGRIRRSAAITSSTSSSGAEAPAVTPAAHSRLPVLGCVADIVDIRSDDIVEPPPQRSDDHAHARNLSLRMNETIESIRKSTMRDAHAATRSRRTATVCAALSGLPVGHREA